jgi:DNA-binding NtrC family response regulator
VERASLLTEHARIGIEHLPPEVISAVQARSSTTTRALPPSPLRSVERDALERALVEYRGNRRDLALALGLSERTLYRKLREYGLSRRPVEPDESRT